MEYEKQLNIHKNNENCKSRSWDVDNSSEFCRHCGLITEE